MIETLLTTTDNPFDPFNDWDAWYSYDTLLGHNTLGLLDRIIVTSNELSDADQTLAFQQAVDEIIKENVSGVHRKVTREIPDLISNDI